MFKEAQAEILSPPFNSVAIVGLGQVGTMLNRQFSHDGRYRLYPAGRDQIKEVMSRAPQVVILATPNPIREVVQKITQAALSPFTLILPQNGIGVVEQTREVVDETRVSTIIRASLFTPVSLKEGEISYNPKKLRIALASENKLDEPILAKAKQLFDAAGFEVITVEDFKSLEWTKLLANCLGSTSTVTGLPPYETFTDPDLFALEIQGLKNRIRIIRAKGFNLVNIPWIKPLELVNQFPTRILSSLRKVIAQFIAGGRDNLPSAAARKIVAGEYPTEVLEYHRPFTLARTQHNLRSPVDEALLAIIERHNKHEVNLREMNPVERKQLLLQTVKSIS